VGRANKWGGQKQVGRAKTSGAGKNKWGGQKQMRPDPAIGPQRVLFKDK
jgi:hypothetical protein